MADAGFYNTNMFRDYPFLSIGTPVTDNSLSESLSSFLDFPQSVLVDFGAVIGPSAAFNPLIDYVYLKRISRTGGTFSLVFAVSSLDSDYDITFLVNDETSLFENIMEESIPQLAEVGTPEACSDSPMWFAFIAVGDVTPLLDLVDDGVTIELQENLWSILPTRIQSLTGTQVEGITIGNKDRTRVSAAADCASSAAVSSSDLVFIASQCLVGDIRFVEGFNAAIRYDLPNNAIVFSASPGAGKGQPCEEVPIYEGETRPDGSRYFSGGPACNQILRSLNGASAQDLVFQGGAGFTVQQDTQNPNTLIISKRPDAFATCTSPDAVEESSSISDGGWL